ncbi:MAG TPA: hypothetical protein VFW22_06975 [Pseudolabrys sp.]|nr:hypothetical protein [Pseudolabrys sp.]
MKELNAPGGVADWNVGRAEGMASAEEYRRYAAQCLSVAERQSSTAEKARLIEMAQAFLRMAEKKERGDLDD